MRNIFLFIRRYFNFVFFLLLQGFCIYLIVHYSRYHNAVFSRTTTQLTGKLDAQFNRIDDYFHLKRVNDSLLKANTDLYNKLRSDYSFPDSVSRIYIDSMKVDSMERYRRYLFLPATVVANSVTTQSNFIVLGRGSGQQLKDGMGVVDINRGVVGRITASISKDYAVVMSLLHKDSKISGKLFNSGETGTVTWDGKTPNLLTLSGIPKSAKVAVGDTIITSGFSTSFPKGMLIGYVTAATPEKNSSNYSIRLRSAADFYNLQLTYAIGNLQQDEINALLQKAEKQNQ